MNRYDLDMKDGSKITVWGESYKEAIAGTTINRSQILSYTEVQEHPDNAAGS